MEVIEKITRKFEANGSSSHNDGNFSNFNKYEDGKYGGDIIPY